MTAGRRVRALRGLLRRLFAPARSPARAASARRTRSPARIRSRAGKARPHRSSCSAPSAITSMPRSCAIAMIERRITGRAPLPFGAHERLVDLDRVEREALQVGERRMAGAEIVEREADAELAHARQHLRGIFGVLHHQRLGQFELERAARDRRARQHGAQVLDQVVAQQLARRDVDAAEQRIAQPRRALPGGELARRRGRARTGRARR